jgi:DNA-binding NtrC family response regulator
MRVGGTTPIPIDVRVISATKTDLKELVDRGMFRADLYYRLNVVPIEIPPLRDRQQDIPLLIDHFIKRFAPDRPIAIDRDALQILTDYYWPGNIRELRNVIQRVTLFSTGTIAATDLPLETRCGHPVDLMVKTCVKCFACDGMGLEQIVTCLEAHLIEQALQQSAGNRIEAARILKMNPSTFRDKMKKHNIP